MTEPVLGAVYKQGDRVSYVSDPIILKRLEEHAKYIHERGGAAYDPKLMPYKKLNYAEGTVQCVHGFYFSGLLVWLYGVVWDDPDVNRLLSAPQFLLIGSALVPAVDIKMLDPTPPQEPEKPKDTPP